MSRLLRSASFALAVVIAGFASVERPAEAQAPVRLRLAVDDVVDPVLLPASEVEYVVEVINTTATPLSDVIVSADTPAGTTFGEASTTVGTISVPAQGGLGTMTVTVGSLAPGTSARIRFELGLDVAAGTKLDFAASVSSGAGDALSASESTYVENRGAAILRWDAIADAGLPKLARVERPVEPLFHQTDFPVEPVLSDVEYRVYRSNTRDVEPTEANLVATFPASQLNTGALSEPGFYAVTAVAAGDETAPTNATSFDMGEPLVDSVTVLGRALKARGSNFDPNVEVSVDGLRFVKPASVSRDGTRVNQDGKLENGVGLKKYFPEHFVSLVEYRNANGAVASVKYVNLTFQP